MSIDVLCPIHSRGKKAVMPKGNEAPLSEHAEMRLQFTEPYFILMSISTEYLELPDEDAQTSQDYSPPQWPEESKEPDDEERGTVVFDREYSQTTLSAGCVGSTSL